MIRPHTVGILLTVILLIGCAMLHSMAQSGKPFAPENFGLTPLAPKLYVEALADDRLLTHSSLEQWLAAVYPFGEGNGNRTTKGAAPIRPVYAAARHEMHPCLAHIGRRGLQAFMARLNAGENFELANLSLCLAP